jgi:hypothetical protein
LPPKAATRCLPVRAFGLHPILAATGPIRAVAALRDNSLEPHRTGMAQHGPTVAGNLLAQTQVGAGLEVDEDSLERAATLLERTAAQVLSVQPKEVEDVIDRLVGRLVAGVATGLADAEGGLEGREARHTTSSTTASPSKMADVTGSPATASAMVGKRAVQSCPRRVRSTMSPRARCAISR